jgi:NADH-quinone oxidoreductase subunit L
VNAQDAIVKLLWLAAVLPLTAGGLGALLKRRHRAAAALLAIGSVSVSLVVAVGALAAALRAPEPVRQALNFNWFQAGNTWVTLGWVLDPLSAVMLVMVALVSLLIFVFSVGYMAQDENFTRFFCFLSLFAGAMLGLVIANSLLLLFICWELVGLTSYLLIGFWYQKPTAAAAAKKAFITTRIGDLAFLLGMIWLYSETGTLLFYDQGRGCLEQPALNVLALRTAGLGVALATAIGLLLFLGAVGKSGQLPLHVWLPDAMEGPTPVSALIHAATMVAAGVFLIARVYPLVAMTDADIKPTGLYTQSVPGEAARANPGAVLRIPIEPPDSASPSAALSSDNESHSPKPTSTTLKVVTWVGVLTALFAASIAVAQTDIKRILAYSTVSQLGFMMLGLGTGGVAVGMFHLITHAFFKALLFLGSGSVIHGCHEEQDIRRMGGLRKLMPVTFATYAIGMMALSGVPILFSGFWSKDEILHAAASWPVSRLPFLLAILAALLTAFYMTRQICYVFFGSWRGAPAKAHGRGITGAPSQPGAGAAFANGLPHESPALMTGPLLLLAAGSIVLGFFGTPAWPWFQGFLLGRDESLEIARLLAGGTLGLMALSALVAGAGILLGYWLYGRRPSRSSDETDVLERFHPAAFAVLRQKYYFDEFYDLTVVCITAGFARACDWADRVIWGGAVRAVSLTTSALSWASRMMDEYLVNGGFDRACGGLGKGGSRLSQLQNGQVQHYLRAIAAGLVVLALLLLWGCRNT